MYYKKEKKEKKKNIERVHLLDRILYWGKNLNFHYMQRVHLVLTYFINFAESCHSRWVLSQENQ